MRMCDFLCLCFQGPLSARVVRLLLDRAQLEEKQVGDVALIPAKEARALLYKLLAAKVVHLQEIPRKPDHAPMNTYYLWSVVRPGGPRVSRWPRQPTNPVRVQSQNMKRLRMSVVQRICKAILNMRLRVRHEDEKAAQVRLHGWRPVCMCSNNNAHHRCVHAWMQAEAEGTSDPAGGDVQAPGQGKVQRLEAVVLRLVRMLSLVDEDGWLGQAGE